MTQIKTEICMLLNNNMTHDSRVLKEATSLADAGWKVAVISHYVLDKPDNLPLRETVNGFEIYRFPIILNPLIDKLLIRKIGVLFAFRLFQFLNNFLPIQYLADWWFHRTNYLWTKQFRTLSNIVHDIEADVFHVHDYPNLLLLFTASPKLKKVVYDSHEVYFDRVSGHRSDFQQALDSPGRKAEKELVKICSAVITVGDKIADHLAQTLEIERPIILRNAVDLGQNSTTPAEIFPTNNTRTVVHSGGIIKGRQLHQLIESMAYLPDDIAIVLVGSGPLEDDLLAIAQELGAEERLFIIPPVQPHEVSATIAQGDVAAVLMNPSAGLNGQFSLPNKFFEAVAAGLPMVTSQAPEISQLTQQYEIGISVDASQPKAIAQAILDILEPQHYQVYRQNVEKARSVLNWDQEEKKLIQLYESLLE